MPMIPAKAHGENKQKIPLINKMGFKNSNLDSGIVTLVSWDTIILNSFFFFNLGQGHHLPKSERCAHTPMGVCVCRGGEVTPIVDYECWEAVHERVTFFRSKVVDEKIRVWTTGQIPPYIKNYWVEPPLPLTGMSSNICLKITTKVSWCLYCHIGLLTLLRTNFTWSEKKCVGSCWIQL